MFALWITEVHQMITKYNLQDLRTQLFGLQVVGVDGIQDSHTRILSLVSFEATKALG